MIKPDILEIAVDNTNCQFQNLSQWVVSFANNCHDVSSHAGSKEIQVTRFCCQYKPGLVSGPGRLFLDFCPTYFYQEIINTLPCLMLRPIMSNGYKKIPVCESKGLTRW